MKWPDSDILTSDDSGSGVVLMIKSRIYSVLGQILLFMTTLAEIPVCIWQVVGSMNVDHQLPVEEVLRWSQEGEVTSAG